MYMADANIETGNKKKPVVVFKKCTCEGSRDIFCCEHGDADNICNK